MNAYELAKYLYRLNGYMDMPKDILDITHPSADMLIQQADLLEYYIIRDKSNQRTIKDLSSKIVFASDIKLYGYGHSDEYKNGFWDAVNFVKKYQSRGEE